MTTQRDVFQASANAAIARYDEAVGKGVWRTTARNQMVDQLLKAWEATVTRALRDLHRPGDTPAERRAVLYEARTDIGGQPWRATETARMAGRT